MNFLANVPVWVFFVVMAVTFMFVHVLAFDPHKVVTRGAGATTAMRLGSSLILLLGLLLMQPAEPVTLLLALAAAAVGGFISGKAAPPPRRAEQAPSQPAEGAAAPGAGANRADDEGEGEPGAHGGTGSTGGPGTRGGPGPRPD